MKLRKYISIIIISIFTWITIGKSMRPFIKTLFNQDSPQLILVLGGDVDREKLGLNIANKLQMPIIISGGSNPEYSDWLIAKIGISSSLVRRDYRAKDTLSNFTSLVDEISKDGINHALLITSEDHINRAMTIGTIVAGSRGIRLTSIPVPCAELCQQETQKKHYFDLIRAITWVGLGKDLKDVLPLEMKVHLQTNK